MSFGKLTHEARQRKLVLWLPLWVCAIFLLFANLGVSSIMGSEARWLIVAREMLRSGDWFHPTINAEPYFDKPLLTYWLIAIPSSLHGAVTEFTGRLYSVVSALAALGGLILIARRFLDEKTSVAAGWLFLSLVAFGTFGRLAEADMANLAFSTWGILIYLYYADKKSLAGYISFFAVCCIGAHAKGMAAIAVPCLAVLADLIISKRWTFHLNLKFLAGLIIGGILYILPFLIAKYTTPAIPVSTQTTIDTDGTLMTSGIALAFRENVIRFFAPFDHVQPFYVYFIHLPRHLLPWTPLFILALIQAWQKRKDLPPAIKWLLLTIGLIFLFFTLSGSRRHYYILPILPFCMILTAWYLTESSAGWSEKLKTILLRIYTFLPIILFALAICALAVYKIKPDLMPSAYRTLFEPMLRQTLFVMNAVFFSILIFQWRFSKFGAFAGESTPSPALTRAIFSMTVSVLFFFVYLLPVFSLVRTEKQIDVSIGNFLKRNRVPADCVYFYRQDNQRAVFYMDLPYKVTILKSPEELSEKRASLGGRAVFLIAQKRCFTNEQGLRTVISERILPWEKKNRLYRSKKMELRVTPLK